MSHAILANIQAVAPAEIFQSIWTLTRTMMAAGWRYKASADGSGASGNKDTTANPANDKWAVGGAVNTTQVGAQTGTAPVIGAPSSGISIISSVSGFVANSVGRFVKITGALNALNNGLFRITSQTGTTVSVFNPGAVAETTPSTATWTEVQGGAAASVANSSLGRAIVTGVTGMVLPTTSPLSRGSVGDHFTFINAATGANNGTFRITRVVSATSVEIDNGSAVSDANNGSLIWVESSPTAQVYSPGLRGATGTGAWLVLQGPSTMKLPIGANTPTGTFVIGEKVTATTSGATGTIIGLMVDTGSSLGFVVVQPRVNGSGSGPRGWTSGGTDTLTGAQSGATIATTTTIPVEYVREHVFWKDTQILGHIFMQCIDQNLESASRFSVLAANAAITNILAPGGSGAGGFPTPGSWVALGQGGQAAVATGAQNWHYTNSIGSIGFTHVMCADCMETSTTDADGSWIVALGTPTQSGGQTQTLPSYAGTWFMRCDGNEDGDVDPYVSFQNLSTSGYAGTRTGPSAATADTTNDIFCASKSFLSTSQGGMSSFAGWRRRGFASADAWQQFQGMCLTNNAQSALQITSLGIGRTQSAISEQFIKEAVWIISTQSALRMRKGFLRWAWMTEGGVCNNTYLGATWVQLSGGQVNAPLVCGPWDGTSLPLEA